MSNELTTVSNWGAFKEQAEMLVKSGFLPVSINTPEKALAIAMTAKELGVGVMEGFRSINIIQGKPCVSPQLMLALAMRTGQLQQIKYDSTDERCKITIIRKGWEPHTEEFGVKEATALGLINRDNYRKQASIMFRWRALAAGLRVTFSDVVLGLYNPEEMGAEVRTNSEGDMEIIDDQMVNTGVRIPAGFSKMTPEEQQERIGAGNVVRGTETGKFIFTPKEAIESFKEQFPEKELNTPENANVSVQGASEGGDLITLNEQLELVRLAKERKIHHLSMKKLLKEEFGVDGSAKLTKDQYPKVVEAIIRFEVGE